MIHESDFHKIRKKIERCSETKCESLDLHDLACEKLPDEICGLSHLKKLDISHNPHLKNLNGLQELHNLEELDASHCENLSDLTALKGLATLKKLVGQSL